MKKHSPFITRDLITGPYVALFLREEDFLKEMKRLKIKDHHPYLSPTTVMCVHVYHNDKTNDTYCCVCVHHNIDQWSPVQIVGFFVHESVHIWQSHCKKIGEQNPSDEFEAYAIESIATKLIEKYNALTSKKKKKKCLP